MIGKLSKKSTLINWRIRNLTLCLFTFLLIAGAMASPLFAQVTGEPALQIKEINIEQLPLVGIMIGGENLSGSLDELDLSIREDGIAHPIVSGNPVNVGLQIAFVIDPATDLSQIGNSGDPFRLDIAYGASSLIESGILEARTDWLAAFALPETSDAFRRITSWQRDHQGVVNTLFQLESTNFSTDISLADSLSETINDLLSMGATSDLERSLIIFSDGTGSLSSSDKDSVIRDAQVAKVSINVVMLGDGSTTSQQSLKQVAEATNGQYLIYENKESLTSVWDRLDTSTSLYEFTYRMARAQPSQVAVFAELANDKVVLATEDFPVVNLSPVQIAIEQPDSDEVVTRAEKNADSDLSEWEPKTLPIQIAFEWPDGVERSIQSVQYEIGDMTATQDEPPFNVYEIPIADLDEGNYTLSISAIDEYGITSDLTQQPFQVKLGQSEVELANSNIAVGAGAIEAEVINDVTEDPQSVDVQQRENEQGMNILGIQLPETVEIFGVTFLVNGITLLIALFPIIFLLALLLYWLTQRNEKVAEPDYGYYEYDNNGYFYRFEPAMDDMQLTQPQVSALDTDDELTMPVQLPSFYTNADAYLVYVSGGDHLPKKVPIEANEPVRIGRKKSFCDQILDDQRVSRLHAVITCEAGSFYIKDEGSSGGTFVNRRKLTATDKQLLKHSDIVNFNEVEYRFEVSSSNNSPNITEPLTANRPEPLLPKIDFE
ncbi:MAG: FHA domain-containing protein [Chloroflexota bacterium]